MSGDTTGVVISGFVSGGVTNTGTISPNGIIVASGGFISGGNILDSGGIISGGISVASGGEILTTSTSANAIDLENTPVFASNIVNAGIHLGSPGRHYHHQRIDLHRRIINTGTISALFGASIDNSATFDSGITNTGDISALDVDIELPVSQVSGSAGQCGVEL